MVSKHEQTLHLSVYLLKLKYASSRLDPSRLDHRELTKEYANSKLTTYSLVYPSLKPDISGLVYVQI